MEPILLKHEQIELHTLEEKNAEEIFSIIDRNRAGFREWLPWIDGTLMIEDSQKYIASTLEQSEKGTGFFFSIRFENKIVGVVAFNYIHKANRKGHIGYWLDELFEGKGIMTKACMLLINYGFKRLNLHRIEIACAVGNNKSCAIPERLGFTKEGTLRDSEWLYDHFVDQEFYSIIAEEWKQAV